MLDPCQSILGWSATAQTGSIALNTTTFLHGASSLSFAKSGGGAVTGTLLQLLPCPVDVTELRDRAASLSFWLQHATWVDSNTDDVSSMSLDLVYKLDSSLAPTVYDRFTVAGATLKAGAASWVAVTTALSSPTSSTGSPDDTARRHLVAIQLSVTLAQAASTLTGILLGAVAFTGVPYSVIEFEDANSRGRVVLSHPFEAWRMSQDPQFTTLRSELATSITYKGSRATIAARYQRLEQSYSEWTSLRRWADFTKANTGWGIAYLANELLDTTLDAASGAGQSDPRVLNVLHTQSFAFLLTTLALDPVRIRVGPNTDGMTEYAEVQEVGTSGSSGTIILRSALKYAYASGDAVRSEGYFPSLVLSGAGAYPVVSGDQYDTVELAAEEA